MSKPRSVSKDERHQHRGNDASSRITESAS